MLDLFGSNRSVLKDRYALLTPAGLATSSLPGWEKAICQVAISPALGARFCQLLVTLEADGQCAGNTGANQYFIYLLEGNASILLDDRRHRLEAGNYAYLPAGKDVQLRSTRAATRVLIFQKPYQVLPGTAKPAPFVSHEREVPGRPFPANDDARLQTLLPDQPAFDLAVNILTFPPGAGLPLIETPIMERGVLLLKGQGLCRLNGDWHPVQAGDVIWLAPYCPQWFVAIGKTPASYICCQDVNRDPM